MCGGRQGVQGVMEGFTQVVKPSDASLLVHVQMPLVEGRHRPNSSGVVEDVTRHMNWRVREQVIWGVREQVSWEGSLEVRSEVRDRARERVRE